ncbi:MAG TPA: hypothetical protein VMR14_01370 [Streptosporangiaceae bacterium]|jgi:hypothetical protein|nr:hypothetical protein [Streptosporangiaceae bacterium]
MTDLNPPPPPPDPNYGNPNFGNPNFGNPNFGYGASMTPEQLAYQRGQQDMIKTLTKPRMSVFRILCGISWAVVAVVLAVGGIGEIGAGNVGGAILCLVIAALAGWYDYRIWTLKARRLWLFI